MVYFSRIYLLRFSKVFFFLKKRNNSVVQNNISIKELIFKNIKLKIESFSWFFFSLFLRNGYDLFTKF